MGRVDDKVVLITGGARGQGAAEARLLASEGARVMLSDVLDAEGEEVAASIGDAARFAHHDVTSAEDWERVVGETLDWGGRIDVLVNNAGIFRVVPMTATDDDLWNQVIAVNQTGVFLGMRAVSAPMITQGAGSIVNISSVAGLRGSGAAFAYSTSKWAVRGMTKAAAQELAPHGIRVNSVHPGIINTQMITEIGEDWEALLLPAIPMGRVAQADDVARLVLYLASDESAYSTGAEFVVDGGMTI